MAKENTKTTGNFFSFRGMRIERRLKKASENRLRRRNPAELIFDARKKATEIVCGFGNSYMRPIR